LLSGVVHMPKTEKLLAGVPRSTVDWLLAEENPAVAVLSRRTLLGERDDADTKALWARRNEYAPVRTILEAQHDDGSWAPPARDYQKYWGSLWQVHFLGEMWADPSDERVRRAAEYAFSRQLPDGSWSANGRETAAIPCLTANVGRAVARLGFAEDERVTKALGWIARLYARQGSLGCGMDASYAMTINGYCHMLAPKLLLFLAEVPRDRWPDGAEELRDAAVGALRDKQVYRCLPTKSREFFELIWTTPPKERLATRERYVAENAPFEYGDKPGWLRFGFPLSYNSDALEALAALAAVGEPMREEYAAAVEVVRKAADREMRWKLRNSFNGKMLADVEVKGEPSRWLTLRGLQVLAWAEAGA
jgi:hypothetical protein